VKTSQVKITTVTLKCVTARGNRQSTFSEKWSEVQSRVEISDRQAGRSTSAIAFIRITASGRMGGGGGERGGEFLAEGGGCPTILSFFFNIRGGGGGGGGGGCL